MKENKNLKSIWDFLDEQDQEEFSIAEEDRPKYVINDTIQAENVTRYYKRTIQEIARLQQELDNWKADIQKKQDEYINKVVAPLEEKARFFEAQLRDFAEKQIAGTKKKSVKLLEGTLQFTKTQDKYEHDDDVILDFINGLGAKNKLRSYLKPQPAKLDWKNMKDASVIREVTLDDGTKENHIFVNEVEIPAVTVKVNLPPSFKVK